MPRKKPKIPICADCGRDVAHTGNETYTVEHGTIPGHMVPMNRRIYTHAGGDGDHKVERITHVEAPPSKCKCCGDPGRYRLCPACREAHHVYTYILSLRCPVREAKEIAEADATALLNPDSPALIKRNMGHSDECWSTTPMNLTDEIKQRCGCAFWPEKPARAPISDKARATAGELEATKGGLRVPSSPSWQD